MTEVNNNQVVQNPPVAPNNAPVQLASQHVVDQMKEQSLGFFNPTVWEGINKMAVVFHNSGALPKAIDSTAKVIMVLQAGKEVGMQPVEALQAYAFINGRLTMFGNAVIAQVAKAGHDITWGHCDDQTATVTVTRCDNKKSMTETYTIEDAKRAGLINRDVWKAYPRRMLKYKAFAEVANFLTPDALHGAQMREIVESEPVEEPKVVVPTSVTDTGKRTAEVRPVTPDALPTLDQAMAENEANKKVEVMPAKPTKTRGEKVLEENKKKVQGKAGSWPQEVCRLVRFLADIDDQDLPLDMIQLKDDAVKGEFRGYEAYPTIGRQLSFIPEDFN